MVLRLDPRVPLVWRDPTTLQAGGERPMAILTDAGPGVERLLAALAIGVDEAGVEVVAELAGLTPERGAEVVEVLRPAMLPGAGRTDAVADGLPGAAASGLTGTALTADDEAAAAATPRTPRDDPAPTRRPRIAVDGDGPLADLIARLLGDEATVLRTRPDYAPPRSCAAAVVVASRVGSPAAAGVWLRRDVPHLLVLTHETDVEVGPLVLPGIGPCLLCRHLALADADAAWPAVAAQLAVLPTPPQPAVVLAEAAALAARRVLELLHPSDRSAPSAPLSVERAPTSGRAGDRRAPSAMGDTTPAGLAVRLDAATGARSERVWLRHPDCWCTDATGDPAPSTAAALRSRARRGTGSASADRLAPPRRRTMRPTPASGPA